MGGDGGGRLAAAHVAPRGPGRRARRLTLAPDPARPGPAAQGAGTGFTSLKSAIIIIIMLALSINNRGGDTALWEGRCLRRGGVLLGRVVYGRVSLLRASVLLRSFACSL